MRKEVRIIVVGKVFKANKGKILALNKCLEEYFRAVKYFLSFNSTSKHFYTGMVMKKQSKCSILIQL